jgi:hypothetical protein
MPNRPRLSYANIVSTLALFLAIGGGEVSTQSTTLQRVEQSIGTQPQIDPLRVDHEPAQRQGPAPLRLDTTDRRSPT